MTVTEHVPSPADTPEFTADELLAEIERRGGRIYRMREVSVFCLTQDEDVANWLKRLGGKSFVPTHMPRDSLGPSYGYRRTRQGPWEWDIYIHIIPVKGEETIHEAARRYRGGRRVEDE